MDNIWSHKVHLKKARASSIKNTKNQFFRNKITKKKTVNMLAGCKTKNTIISTVVHCMMAIFN